EVDNCRDYLRHFSTDWSTAIFFSLINSASYKNSVPRSLRPIDCPSPFSLHERSMFKISVIDTRAQRRLVLEGKLIAPWTGELESAWRSAREQLQGRKLVIDLTNVTVIGPDGEKTL